MDYEPYVKNARKFIQEALVKIGFGGNLYLNTYTMRNYFNELKYVILLCSKAGSSFAIKPVKKQGPNTYKLGFSSSKRQSTGVIAARGFVESPLIKKYKGTSCKAEWKEKEKFLEVKL